MEHLAFHSSFLISTDKLGDIKPSIMQEILFEADFSVMWLIICVNKVLVIEVFLQP